MQNDYDYAHNDTSVPERQSRTENINKPVFSPLITSVREKAFLRRIPVSSDETLAFLAVCVAMAKPERILEIGTAVGVSGICMLERGINSRLTTIELNPDFAAEARANFDAAKMGDRATVLEGDAAKVLPTLNGGYDFIFLDGPKVQYVKYLPELKRLLTRGGTLFADDVLLYGWVNGECETPPKRKMLVAHIREYLEAVESDPELETTVIDVGNGVALSVKR